MSIRSVLTCTAMSSSRWVVFRPSSPEARQQAKTRKRNDAFILPKQIQNIKSTSTRELLNLFCYVTVPNEEERLG